METFELQVFDLNGRRLSGHWCDGNYEDRALLLNAIKNVLHDKASNSFLVRRKTE